MAVHAGYVGAKTCTSGPQPGAKALMAAFLGVFAARGGTNLGIYNCRAVRGSTSTTSLHGEGRACDFGINPHGAAWGDTLAELLRAHSAELGIQCVIWNRRIWSGAQPHAGWRTYTGTNPHLDHIHVELTWAAAQNLTAATAHSILAGTVGATSGEDDLSAKAEQDIALLVQQLVTGPDPKTWGWPTFPGGSNDRFTVVDYLRKQNARAEDVMRELANLRTVVNQLRDTTPTPTSPTAGPVSLTDADVARVAAAVVDLLSKRTAS